MRKLFFVTGLILLVLYAGIRCAVAQNANFFKFKSGTPWHVEADSIRYDKQTGNYIAQGDVELTRQGKSLIADWVRFDENTRSMTAEGHVVMTSGSDVLMGERMEMDMTAETGTIYRSTIFLAKKHFYFQGDRIQKIGPDSYAADSVSFTSCNPEEPAWRITGKDLNVTVEGYGSVWHATLWAKKVPVFYTPYLFFPVKRKRQTGLLVPWISYSDRKWEVYEQPFYWDINGSSDLTLYDYHMGRRGEKLGFEYRQAFDSRSRLTLMADFLKDRKINDKATDEHGYNGDKWLRPNKDRYWIRGKYDQALPGGFFAKLDIDVVSDQDYLKTFQDGYTGYEAEELKDKPEDSNVG